MKKEEEKLTMKQRMDRGLIYDCSIPELLNEQGVYQDYLYDYNQTRPSQGQLRMEMLQKILGSCGEGTYIEPPFYANWGGHNVYMGKYIFANYHLTCVDDGNIYIGDYTMIGPNVTITSAGHPIEPGLRMRQMQFNKDVHIGKNVWLGAGVIVLPGVTIGDNAVIGAGSVVTKDIPADVVALGSPCRVLRPISQHDKEFFFKDERIDWENL